ncbi:MAG: metallophosphoesterase [Myxococcota bacterium]|nr:metallophosphoesterase [Myxococcota bacterium]
MRATPLFVVILCLSVALPARAAIKIGPYLQAVTTDSAQVLWEADSASTGEVHFGTDPSMTSTEPSAGSGVMHQVELTGLSASTLYHYEVQTSEGTSATYSFLTAPMANEPFSLAFVGDTRTNHWDHEDVIDRLIETVGYPDMIVNTGDLVEDGDEADQWEEFFSIEHEVLARGALVAAPGNHDDSGDYAMFDQYLEPPSTNGNGHYHSFDYGNLHMLVIDTQETFFPGTDQYDFIQADLMAASADPAIDHLWVSGHWPAYSSGAHGIADHDEWGQVRDYLQPLFDVYGVQIYWCGHDHHYERAVVNNVTYIVTGGGGAPADLTDFLPEELAEVIQDLGIIDPSLLYGDIIENLPGWELWLALLGLEYEGNDAWHVTGYMLNHFVWVQIAGGLFQAEVYDVDGTLIDNWSYGASDPTELDDDGDGFSEQEGDCDDSDAAVNPLADEACNGIDDNCDGNTDEGCGDDDTADDDTDDDDDDTADDDTGDDDTGEDAADDDSPGEGNFLGGCECQLRGARAARTGGLAFLAVGLAWTIRRRAHERRSA